MTDPELIRSSCCADHRIRIADAAVVAAVEISAAHIPDRYLPDKAIDLIDEAASHLKLEAESVPLDVAAAEQALVRLQIEHHAFREEEGDVAEHRREWLATEFAQLSTETRVLRERWETEKRLVARVNDLLREEEAARAEEDQARRAGNLTRVAELAYRVLPEISRRIEALQDELKLARVAGTLLRDVVTVQDVAAVAASWTGKPVDVLLGTSSSAR